MWPVTGSVFNTRAALAFGRLLCMNFRLRDLSWTLPSGMQPGAASLL
jgi:hypothetical protein